MKKGFLRKLTAGVCAAVISVSTMGAAVSAQWAKSKDGDYYYLTSEGKAAVGTCKIGSSYYHFGKDGKMYTGWLKKGSSYYYFRSNGKMATGWMKIGGSKYYFGKNGKMVTGTVSIDGLTYNFSSKGVWDGKAGKKASGIRAVLDSQELSPDYFLSDGKDEYGLNSELFSMYFGSSFTEKDADKLIKKKLAEITKGKDSNYDKVKAVYDWIIKNTSYDYGGYGNYLSCDCLINDKIGTCADYSFVFMAMMRYLGYDAEMVSGQTHTSNGGFTGHEWVEVTVGGTVYVFDPQVEDNIAGRNNGKIQYLRFCKTYKEVDGKYKK